jgi:hypothetical protein
MIKFDLYEVVQFVVAYVVLAATGGVMSMMMRKSL